MSVADPGSANGAPARPRLIPQQDAVVQHVLDHQVTVVGAGAGAGKTFTSVAVVLALIEDGRASIDQLVLITFTNQAADELRGRVETALAERVRTATTPDARALWRTQRERLAAAFVGTIHSFCAGILRTYGYDERVAREATVTLSGRLLTEALNDAVEASLDVGNLLTVGNSATWQAYHLRDCSEMVLASIRARGLAPDEIAVRTAAQLDDAGKPYRLEVAQIIAGAARRHTDAKLEEQVLDAEDLLARAGQLLAGPGGPRVLERLSARYRYLFVDEFQDTDRLQKRLLDALIPSLSGGMIVGDRKRSIYGFRAADVSLIDELATEQGVDVLPLNVSRRPTGPLLRVQNALFTSISARQPELGEPLEAAEQAPATMLDLAPLTYLAVPSAARREGRIAATADQLVKTFTRRIYGDDGTPRPAEPGDLVILTRTNRHASAYYRGLRELLEPRGITVVLESGGLFYQQPEIVATFRLLNLILRHPDDVALSLALQTPYLEDVDAGAREQSILQYQGTQGQPLTDWFEDAWHEKAAMLADLRRAVRSETVPQILSRLYEAFEARRVFTTRGGRRALENLERLRQIARNLFREDQALTLRQFVEYLQVALQTRREEAEGLRGQDDDVRPPYVCVTTIHRAKGREFPIVIVPEFQTPLNAPELEPTFVVTDEDGLDIGLPIEGVETRSTRFGAAIGRSTQSRIAEELRIFYVAVTRAREAVILVGTPFFGAGADPDSPYYACKDEVVRAWSALHQLGAVLDRHDGTAPA